MHAQYARPMAQDALKALSPYCERIEIAGSLRRQLEVVSDVEIVCLPRTADYLQFVRVVNGWPKLKGEPTGKYTRRLLSEPRFGGRTVELDLFICNRKTWAMNLFIRTGSADFVKEAMMRFQRLGLQSKEAQLYRNGTIPMNLVDEEQVFAALGCRWIEPQHRTGGYALKQAILAGAPA